MHNRLLTVNDLATRWSCCRALAWSKAKANIPGVWLGKGQYEPAKAGPKTIRFRLASVEAFEQQAEIALTPPKAPARTAKPIPRLWDGVSRLGIS